MPKDHRKYPVIIICILLACKVAFTQSGKEYEKTFYDGNFHLLYERYEEALTCFRALADKYPGNSNLNYKTGVCMLEIPGYEAQAIPYLEKAKEHTTKKYRENSHRERKAPREAYLLLGIAYRSDIKLDEAEKQFEKYQTWFDEGDSEFSEAERQLMMCSYAEEALRNPMSPPPVPLIFPTIKGSLSNPCVSGNGNTLAFMVRKEYYRAVYTSRKSGNKWSEPENITAAIESDGYFDCVSISSDGNIILFSRWENENAELYEARFENGRWKRLVPLSRINSRWNETHACLSADGKKLYFSSDRPGGYGGLDLYQSKKGEDMLWGTPVNLGGTINTPYDEAAPSLQSNNILYFSSDGHASMGGMDILFSEPYEKDWYPPQNQGYPLNSTRDDKHFSPTGDQTLGILARFEEPGSGQLMWFVTEDPTPPAPVTLSGRIIIEGQQPSFISPGTELVISDGIPENQSRIPVLKDGTFEVQLPPGNYLLKLQGEKIMPLSREIKLEEGKTEYFELSARYQPLASIVLKNIYFGFDQVQPLEGSMDVLQDLAEILLKYSDLVLTIRGHSDAIGTDAYNLKLSERRAMAIKIFLTEKGIEAKRLKIESMGEKFPLAPNRNEDGSDNPEGRKLNRRVDFLLPDNRYPFIQPEAAVKQ